MEPLLRLKRSQVASAAKVLARAFEKDPVYMFFFPDGSKRLRQNYHLMYYGIRYCMRYGEVYATSPKLEGIALWRFMDPREEQELQDKSTRLFSNWLSFRLMAEVGEPLEKVYSTYEGVLSLHYKLVPFPHWYLYVLGVEPKFQGQGFTSRLLRTKFARIDREQFDCYLDTNNEKNVGFYEHFGFRVVKRYEIPDSDVINWSMVREPPG